MRFSSICFPRRGGRASVQVDVMASVTLQALGGLSNAETATGPTARVAIGHSRTGTWSTRVWISALRDLQIVPDAMYPGGEAERLCCQGHDVAFCTVVFI